MASVYGITTAKIKERFGDKRLIDLTDDANTDTIDELKIEQAIESAEKELHLFAAVYYVTPVAPVPEGLVKILVDSACFNLMTRRPGFLTSGSDEGVFWEKRRKEIVEFLKGLSDKKRPTLLAGAAEKSSPATASAKAEVVSDTGQFSPESMKGY